MYAETLFSDLRHGAAAQALPFTLNVLCFLSTNTTEHKTVLEIFSLKISHLQPPTQGCCRQHPVHSWPSRPLLQHEVLLAESCARLPDGFVPDPAGCVSEETLQF